MTDKEKVKELIALYGNQILEISELPKAYYPGGIDKVKAIYLGCDPSNKHSTELPYVFAHESNIKVFKPFIESHTEQLKQIDLCWDNVYTQNLCRNYFKEETSKNKIWKQVANDYWIVKLKEELSQFDLKIPVLLTSQILLEVLGIDGCEKMLAPQFYDFNVDNHKAIPIPENKNKLGRELIPIYRGKSRKYEVSYHLKYKEWDKYRTSIKQFFKDKN